MKNEEHEVLNKTEENKPQSSGLGIALVMAGIIGLILAVELLRSKG